MDLVRLTKDDLISGNIRKFKENEITNEIVLQIFTIAKESKDEFIQLSSWLAQMLTIELSQIAVPALKTKVYKLLKKRKTGGKTWQMEKSKVFYVPTESLSSKKDIVEDAKEEFIKDLQEEAHLRKEEMEKKSEKISSLKKEKLSLKRKLERSVQKNIKTLKLVSETKLETSQLRSAEDKIKKLEQEAVTVMEKERDLSKMKEELDCSMEEKNKLMEVIEQSESCLLEVNQALYDHEKKMKELREENNDLKEENDYLLSLLNDNKGELTTFNEEKGTYTPQLTQCVMNLLNCQVSASNVPKVIDEVSKLCNITPNKLPSRQTVDRIGDRRLSLSTKQLSEIAKEKNLTMYSDETSKYGRNYEVFAVTDENKNSYVLGLREMHCKSSQTVLETFKEILQDVNELCDARSGSEEGYRILSNIKNTMSDRAATEKKFHQLLQDFRCEILPKYVENWNQLTDDERSVFGKMNNFFCGLHLLVNFEDVCGEALKKFENLHLASSRSSTDCDTDQEGKVECGTIRLIRTCSKAFAKGVDEKSGVHGPFKSYLHQQKDPVQFLRYKHNRFNIFFVLGYITYHHRKHMIDFLNQVHGCTNRLLSSVASDLRIPLYTAGCRALGIISKIVTGPLWRQIESNSHILSLSDILGKLNDFLEEAKNDCNEVILGNLRPFDWEGEDDHITSELFQPDDTDTLTVEILQCLSAAMLTILKRQAADHLPGGKFSTQDSAIEEQSKSTLKHNKLPEFFFGQLDRLMKFRPNATSICNESYIMFLHNKTGDWLNKLQESEREKLLEDSRKEGRLLRERFKSKMKIIEEKRQSILRNKETQLREKNLKALKKKESLTDSILYYGLWQSADIVQHHLQEIAKTDEQMKALKAQLNFRKQVLGQIPSNKKLFTFSEGGQQKSVEQLSANLCILISESRVALTSESQSRDSPLLVGKTVDHTFNDGVYRGKVLSVVPGFSHWYNIKYEGDPAVYVYKLQEDYSNGDLAIIPTSSGGLPIVTMFDVESWFCSELQCWNYNVCFIRELDLF